MESSLIRRSPRPTKKTNKVKETEEEKQKNPKRKKSSTKAPKKTKNNKKDWNSEKYLPKQEEMEKVNSSITASQAKKQMLGVNSSTISWIEFSSIIETCFTQLCHFPSWSLVKKKIIIEGNQLSDWLGSVLCKKWEIFLHSGLIMIQIQNAISVSLNIVMDNIFLWSTRNVETALKTPKWRTTFFPDVLEDVVLNEFPIDKLLWPLVCNKMGNCSVEEALQLSNHCLITLLSSPIEDGVTDLLFRLISWILYPPKKKDDPRWYSLVHILQDQIFAPQNHEMNSK